MSEWWNESEQKKKNKKEIDWEMGKRLSRNQVPTEEATVRVPKKRIKSRLNDDARRRHSLHILGMKRKFLDDNDEYEDTIMILNDCA